MNAPKRLIEVDERTAIALETRAAEQGLSVPELLEEMTTLATSQETIYADEISELDRRWAAIEAGERAVSNDEPSDGSIPGERRRSNPGMTSEARIVD
jgi:hypothetical protein